MNIYDPVRGKYHRSDSSTSQYTYIPKKYILFKNIRALNNKKNHPNRIKLCNNTIFVNNEVKNYTVVNDNTEDKVN